MGAYCFIDGKKIKFWKVDCIENIDYDVKIENIENGTIIFSNDKKGLFIKTKKGILKVIEVQAENSKRMNINDYLRGKKLEKGELFL